VITGLFVQADLVAIAVDAPRRLQVNSSVAEAIARLMFAFAMG
jgi:hypothetical protein